jgi:hypothetical protein
MMSSVTWSSTLPIVVSCIAILAALLTGYQARRLSRQIAQKQGVFRTPEVRFFAYGIEQDGAQERLFIIGCRFSPRKPVIFPFPVAITNAGDKVAKGN